MARQTVSVRRHMNEYIKRKENVMVKQGQNAKTISCIKADTKEPVAGRNGHYKRVPVDTILLREMDYKKEQKAAIHFAKYLNVQKAVSTEIKYRKVKKISGQETAYQPIKKISGQETAYQPVKKISGQEIADQKIIDIQKNREMTLGSLFSNK